MLFRVRKFNFGSVDLGGELCFTGHVSFDSHGTLSLFEFSVPRTIYLQMKTRNGSSNVCTHLITSAVPVSWDTIGRLAMCTVQTIRVVGCCTQGPITACPCETERCTPTMCVPFMINPCIVSNFTFPDYSQHKFISNWFGVNLSMGQIWTAGLTPDFYTFLHKHSLCTLLGIFFMYIVVLHKMSNNAMSSTYAYAK